MEGVISQIKLFYAGSGWRTLTCVLVLDVQSGKSEDVAEKIRRAVESHTLESFGVVLRKTVSIGVSEFPEDSEKIWQCYKVL